MSVRQTPRPSPTLGFSTLEQETVLDELALSGELPAWLHGSLLRTGPAKFEVGGQHMRHWFDGLAMLHRFTIADGRVSYGNRFLESRSYRAAREHGRIVYGEFATDPCRSLFKRVQTLFSPGPCSRQRQRQRCTPRRALRRDDRDAAAGAVRPAHAGGGRRAPVRGAGTAHDRPPAPRSRERRHAQLRGQARPAQQLPLLRRRSAAGLTQTSAPRSIASLPVKRAGLHALVRAHRALARARGVPVRRQPARARAVRAPVHRELPLEARAGHPLHAGRSAQRRVASAAFTPTRASPSTTSTPTTTATRSSSTCAPSRTRAIDRGLSTWSACAPASPWRAAALTRFRLRTVRPLGQPRAARRRRHRAAAHQLRPLQRAPLPLRVGRPAMGRPAGSSGIVKIDTVERSTRSWSQPGCYPGEPVFVARPEAGTRTTACCCRSCSTPHAGTSFLLVLDAGDLSELARAEVPHHIPFGFHGQFSRDVSVFVLGATRCA